MVRITICLVAVLLAGCAATYAPIDIGAGRYQVTATAETGLGGSAKAAHEATEMASRKCRSLGRSLYVVGTQLASSYPNDNAIVTFECR